jgi:hypothetical protein
MFHKQKAKVFLCKKSILYRFLSFVLGLQAMLAAGCAIRGD